MTYDEQIEVTKDQYIYLINNFKGVIAHRMYQGKYYIKIWLMRYAPQIQQIINKP